MSHPAASPSMPPAGEEAGTRLLRRLAWLILAASFGLRAWLACRGGQFFWPDEGRFVAAQSAVQAMSRGQWAQAAELLFSHPDHLLFKLLALVPAGLEHGLGTGPWAPAMVFAAVSTWVLWLIHRAALAAGGSEREALLALGIAAGTNCLFYYSRHYFPYDLALAFLLLAVIADRRSNPERSASLQVGIWAGLGFLTYNGYWSLAAAILILHVATSLTMLKAAVRRGLTAVCGAFLPILAVVAIGRLLGYNLIARSVEFAGTVTQGDLGAAKIFLLEYAWASEHGLAVVWALGVPGALLAAALARDRRMLFWPVFCLALAALLILPSDVLGRFPVSARHARVLAPFLCLSAAVALRPLAATLIGMRWQKVVLALVLVQAAGNFAAPITQVFPVDFEQEAIAVLTEARRSNLGAYRLVNATFLHNPDWVEKPASPGVDLLRRPHPFDFTPYLYEGYPAATRARYLARDLNMRVVGPPADAARLVGYPAGLLDLTLHFPVIPLGISPDPLIGTGVKGRGDMLFIAYEDENRFRIGLDHWGGGAIYSNILTLDRSQPHRLQVCLGSFFPPGSPLASRLFVKWDDTVVFHTETPLHPTAPELITFGHNFIGATTAMIQTSTQISRIEVTPLPVPGTLAAHPAATFRLRLQLPSAGPDSSGTPLIRTGAPGREDALMLRSTGDGRYRISHEHDGSPPLLSAPFAIDASRPVDFIIGMGTSNQGSIRGPARPTLFVSCNGAVIFNRQTDLHPTRPEEIRIGDDFAAVGGAGPRRYAQILSASSLPEGPWPGLPATFSGALRMTLRPLSPTVPGRVEPLLSTGQSGAGDLLFLLHEENGRVRIGLDHWNHALRISAPVELRPDQTLALTIVMGSLFPPADQPAGPGAGELSDWRHRLLVMADDTILLNERLTYHPATSDSLQIGVNALGFSAASPKLQAELLELRQVPFSEITSLPPAP